MTVNRQALLRIADAIEAHPEHFEMEHWFIGPDGSHHHLEDEDDVDLTECGTTACVAGWAVHLFKDDLPDHPWSGDVSMLLGVGGDLFYRSNWPEEWQEMAENEGEAAAAVGLLRHMAETGEDLFADSEED